MNESHYLSANSVNKGGSLKKSYLGILIPFISSFGFCLPKYQTFLECHTSSKNLPKVVIKGNKLNQTLSEIEFILVDNKGKSKILTSRDRLDGRFFDESIIQSRQLILSGKDQNTKITEGEVENGTLLHLSQQDEEEDLSCLAAQDKINKEIKQKKITRITKEAEMQKFTGTFHYLNRSMQVQCISPLIKKSSGCSLETKTSGEEMSSLELIK